MNYYKIASAIGLIVVIFGAGFIFVSANSSTLDSNESQKLYYAGIVTIIIGAIIIIAGLAKSKKKVTPT